ncbi:hypothetical protein [Pediococcus argentinicus]|uniref:hypothetical protein n=1 Tax=Pediococcus argentinicus TaxID=480391 RepID=UPI00070AD01B|nr:hypothetical protein [Pediococcus argentinicus]NKZ22576.1 hypothetical protein [Pediococcus argentinicus]GEP19763.1 hypothetical protein LSA03_11470 [Pediococcus argentinicus]
MTNYLSKNFIFILLSNAYYSWYKYGAVDGAVYPTLKAWLFKIFPSKTRSTATGTFLNNQKKS